MADQRIPPRQKKPGEKEKIAEDIGGRHPGEDKNMRSAADGEGQADSGNPSPEEVTRWQKPVTNQDEQEKITNADDDIPVADK